MKTVVKTQPPKELIPEPKPRAGRTVRSTPVKITKPTRPTRPISVSASGVALSKQDAAMPPRVGQLLQQLRGEQGLTLDELSRAAGVSKSMLSEIEREKANPTIAVAWRLANALGIGLDRLFSQTVAVSEPIRVLKAHDTPMLVNASDSYQLRICGPLELAGKFEWYELTLQAGGKLLSAGHDSGSTEHISVTSGAIEIQTAGETRKIKAGEMARYAADVAHNILNAGTGEAKALLVVIHGS